MQLNAKLRSKIGTGASRRLRRQGVTPAIIYGGNQDPLLVELDHNAIFHALRKESFHSSVIDLSIDGQVHKVLLRDFQLHPFKPIVLHVDFQRVTDETEIHLKVPIHYTGDENSPAVKLGGGLISHVTTEIDVRCLVSKLPEYISVDLSSFTAEQHSLHASDIVLPDGVRFTPAVTKENPVLVTYIPSKSTD